MLQTQTPGGLSLFRQAAPVFVGPACQQIAHADLHAAAQLYVVPGKQLPRQPACAAACTPACHSSAYHGVCSSVGQLPKQPPNQLGMHAPLQPATPAALQTSRWQPGGASLSQFMGAVQEARTRPHEREKAYQSFLCAIQQWGLLDGIPETCGKAGPPSTRVSLPFCGSLSETPILLPILAKHTSSNRCQLEVHACDVDDSASNYWWPGWTEWTSAVLGPRCSLTFQKKDLATESLPSKAFGLVLGIHPLVMGTGCEVPWRRIMANVMQSCQPGARCIFATFYIFEAEKVQSICRDLGHSSEIRENPYYARAAKNELGTHLRYVVIVNV